MTEPHHYPPELFNLLVEAIPKLVRSKRDVIQLFISAGVERRHFAAIESRLKSNHSDVNKFAIVREIIQNMNAAGDSALRSRRELVKRVVEWEDYTGSWPDDVMAAKGLVAEVRRVVNVKDSFARMANERERERNEHVKKRHAEVQREDKRRAAWNELTRKLASCFGLTNAQARGVLLEGVLNDMFALSGIAVREAFRVVGAFGEGVVEQIDGAVEIDHSLYVVEMKWWSSNIGVPEVSTLCTKIFTRPNCGGIVIANPGISLPGRSILREAIVQGRTVFGCTLQSLYLTVEKGEDIVSLLKGRIERARLDKNPYHEL